MKKEFPAFPPGPRWFIFVVVEPGKVGVSVVEGTDTSHTSELFATAPKGSRLGVYVLAAPVSAGDALASVQRMFNGGPRLIDVYRDTLAGVYQGEPGTPPAGNA